MTTTTYDVKIEYRRAKDPEDEVRTSIQAITASSAAKAKIIAQERFGYDSRRKGSVIKNIFIINEAPPPLPQFLVNQVLKFTSGSRKGQKWRITDALNGGRYVLDNLDFRRAHDIVLSEQELIDALQPDTTVEYWALYPGGASYAREHGPIRSSQYGLDQLVQIKITRVDGKIINKELLP